MVFQNGFVEGPELRGDGGGLLMQLGGLGPTHTGNNNKGNDLLRLLQQAKAGQLQGGGEQQARAPLVPHLANGVEAAPQGQHGLMPGLGTGHHNPWADAGNQPGNGWGMGHGAEADAAAGRSAANHSTPPAGSAAPQAVSNPWHDVASAASTFTSASQLATAAVPGLTGFASIWGPLGLPGAGPAGSTPGQGGWWGNGNTQQQHQQQQQQQQQAWQDLPQGPREHGTNGGLPAQQATLQQQEQLALRTQSPSALAPLQPPPPPPPQQQQQRLDAGSAQQNGSEAIARLLNRLSLASAQQQQQQQQHAQQEQAAGLPLQQHRQPQQPMQLPPQAGGFGTLAARGGPPGLSPGPPLGLQHAAGHVNGAVPNLNGGGARPGLHMPAGAPGGVALPGMRPPGMMHMMMGPGPLPPPPPPMGRARNRPWDVGRLDAQLAGLLSVLQPSEQEQAALAQAVDGVTRLLRQEFPHGKVQLYGSAKNGLCLARTNDIDMTLDLGPACDSDAAKAEVVARLGRLLTDARMENVVALPRARVPVVKLVYPGTGTSVDITVNNLLPLENTRLLATYAALDPRLRALTLLVKHWAKTRGVNDTYRGTLSSYAYVLLVIGLLQRRSPAILPNLQALPRAPRAIGGWDVSFCDDPDTLKACRSDNRESVAELLDGFFSYYGLQHDYSNSVVSIRLGGLLSKREKDWVRRQDRDRHLVCIEDPFELSHDLGRCVDWQSVRTLRGELERAARILANEPDPLPLLLQPLQRPPLRPH